MEVEGATQIIASSTQSSTPSHDVYSQHYLFGPSDNVATIPAKTSVVRTIRKGGKSALKMVSTVADDIGAGAKLVESYAGKTNVVGQAARIAEKTAETVASLANRAADFIAPARRTKYAKNNVGKAVAAGAVVKGAYSSTGTAEKLDDRPKKRKSFTKAKSD